MYRHIHIGPATLQTSMLLYLFGFYLATEVIRRHTKRRDPNDNLFQSALFFGFLAGLLGARIVYALRHWVAYHDDLGAWFSITPQGLDTIGGLLIGTAIAILYSWRRGIDIDTFAEAVAPGVGLFMIIMPLAFLAEGTVIGQTTELPWAIDLWGEKRHPTQLYAALGALSTLMVWWRFPSYLTIVGGNALTWLLVGLLLAEPTLILDSYRLSQILAWIALVITTFVWSWRSTCAQNLAIGGIDWKDEPRKPS